MIEEIGNNATGAGNQQERPGIADWIVGFVDGEGTFSVSVFRNRTTSLGWQILPEFVVTQGCRGIEALQLIRDHFRCERIYINHRNDNHREDVARFCIRALSDLSEIIVPFFKEHRLITAKRSDFEKFVEVIELVKKGKHHEPAGLRSIAIISQSMNRRKRSEFLESSETIRQALSGSEQSKQDAELDECAKALSEDIVRPPWRHGEPGRNDLATSEKLGVTISLR